MNESTTPAYLMHLTTDQMRALLSDALAGASDRPMTTEQAAKFLQVAESTLREMAANGAVPAGRLGKEWRFSRMALLAHCRGKKAGEAA